jgi:hypothetical protein
MRNLWLGAAFAIVLLGAPPVVGQPSPAAVPQDPYVLPGYVPAGFGAFGTWTARRKTELYAAAGSHQLVATIDRCEEVTAEHGELRGHPREIRVLKAHAPFRKGERLWILARDLEEGYFQLWYQGAIRDDLAVSLEEELSQCEKPSPKCWLWLDKDSPQEHWVRIRRKDATVGWTHRVQDFVEGHVDSRNCR